MLQGYNPDLGQTIKTDVSYKNIDRAFIAHFEVSADDAVAASNDGVHAGVILQTATQSLSVNLNSPAIPRALRIKGNAAGISGNVVFTGTNISGETITETIVANGENAVEGNKAFKTITNVVFPVRNAPGDTISIGWNDKIGLPYCLKHNTVLFAYLNNAKEGTAPTVAVDDNEIEKNTVDLNSALNGTKVDVYLIV